MRKMFYRLSQVPAGGAIIFQPLATEGREEFMVWDNNQRKFIRSGNINGADGRTHQLEDIKWMKREEFMRIFPNFAKSRKFRWEARVDNVDYDMSFPVSVNGLLSQQINIVRQLGKNPLAFQYILRREGTGLQTRWNVELGTEVQVAQAQLPQQIQPVPMMQQPQAVPMTMPMAQPVATPMQPVLPVAQPMVLPTNVVAQALTLTPEEQKVVDAFKADIQSKGLNPLDPTIKNAYVTVMKINITNITDERANMLYDNKVVK